MDEKIKVKDGTGLMDNAGMIDSIIEDCNALVKKLVEGNYIAFCKGMYEVVKKLILLKKGVVNDIQSRDREIERLTKAMERRSEDAP